MGHPKINLWPQTRATTYPIDAVDAMYLVANLGFAGSWNWEETQKQHSHVRFTHNVERDKNPKHPKTQQKTKLMKQ